MKSLFLLTMFIAGCTYTRVVYPTSIDEQADVQHPTWFCQRNEPAPENPMVCWNGTNILMQLEQDGYIRILKPRTLGNLDGGVR